LELGLSAEEYSALSPEEWGHYLAAWREKRKRDLEGVSILWAMYVNAHRADGASPVKPSDLFDASEDDTSNEQQIANNYLALKKLLNNGSR
jgi:hypothetical protein